MSNRKPKHQTTFAAELRAWRAARHLTQVEAATFLRVPIRTYQEWEQGRQRPDQIGPIQQLIAHRLP